MYKILISLFFFSLISLNASNKPLVFAPLPLEDAKTTYTHFSPMVKYLEKKLQRKIIIDYNKSYDVILKKFTEGKIDLAYLGPLPYLSLEKKYADISPLVNFKNKDGKISYTCSFVKFMTTKTTIKDFKNEKIALTQPLSTCGYLFVNSILDESNINIEENRYRYLGRHDKVALYVIKDEFTFGGLKSEIAKSYYHLGLDEILKSKPIPSFVLVGNSKTLDKKTLVNIKNFLINTPKEELSTWYKSVKYGAVETNNNDYDHLREIIDSTKIPNKSNY